MAATRTLSTKTASRGTKKLASQALLPADCWHLYSCLIWVYRSYLSNIACACHCSWAQAVQWLCAYVPLQLRRLRCCGGAAGFASSWHGSIPCSSLPQSAAIKVSLLRCVIEQHINSRGSNRPSLSALCPAQRGAAAISDLVLFLSCHLSCLAGIFTFRDHVEALVGYSASSGCGGGSRSARAHGGGAGGVPPRLQQVWVSSRAGPIARRPSARCAYSDTVRLFAAEGIAMRPCSHKLHTQQRKQDVLVAPHVPACLLPRATLFCQARELSRVEARPCRLSGAMRHPKAIYYLSCLAGIAEKTGTVGTYLGAQLRVP